MFENFSPYKILGSSEKLVSLKYGQMFPPVQVAINPTDVCDLRCEWCGQEHLFKEGRPQLEWRVLKDLLDQLDEFGVKVVNWSGGGEPLMYPYIVDAIKSCKLQQGMITNGVKLDKIEKVVDRLAYVRVSLDAATPDMFRQIKKVDKFWPVVSGIGMLVARKVFTGVSYVVCAGSAWGMDEFADRMASMGVNFIQFRPDGFVEPKEGWKIAAENVRSKYESDQFKVYLQGFDTTPVVTKKCYYHYFVAEVTAAGKVELCCYLKGCGGITLGDVNVESFQVIWGKRTEALASQGLPDEFCMVCNVRFMNEVVEKVLTDYPLKDFF